MVHSVGEILTRARTTYSVQTRSTRITNSTVKGKPHIILLLYVKSELRKKEACEAKLLAAALLSRSLNPANTRSGEALAFRQLDFITDVGGT